MGSSTPADQRPPVLRRDVRRHRAPIHHVPQLRVVPMSCPASAGKPSRAPTTNGRWSPRGV